MGEGAFGREGFGREGFGCERDDKKRRRRALK